MCLQVLLVDLLQPVGVCLLPLKSWTTLIPVIRSWRKALIRAMRTRMSR